VAGQAPLPGTTSTLPPTDAASAPPVAVGATPAPSARPARARHLLLLLLPILLLTSAVAVGIRWFSATTAAASLIASGTIEYDERTLAAESAGRVADLSVDEGTRVTEGSVVGHLVNPVLSVQNRQATSDPASLQVTEAQLSMLDLVAPSTGIVQKQIAHKGEFVAAGSPVLTVADATNLKLTLYVLEADLGRVSLGQSVSVRTDAFPNQTFNGLVTRIADNAEFTPRNVQTPRDRQNLVFAVTVRIPNANEVLKAGLPVDATFNP
jgi:multidrug resistance efflux pump